MIFQIFPKIHRITLHLQVNFPCNSKQQIRKTQLASVIIKQQMGKFIDRVLKIAKSI